MKTRHYRHIHCANPDCRRMHRTSSTQAQHLCAACQRAAHAQKEADRNSGINGYDRRSTAIYVLPVPVLTVGTCKGPCGRKNQELADGKCVDCRFWNCPDTDEEMSRRAKLAAPAHMRAYRGER
jgi:hypothetical protein